MEKPVGLEGYGADNVVPLRWTAPVSAYQRSIISGYYIERKKKGEVEYKRINDTPVAISYSIDENGILYEAPSFYEDLELKNGDEASYRIQGLDIFGRVSAYSAAIDIKVYKVTAPQTPSVGQPDLSTKLNKTTSPAS